MIEQNVQVLRCSDDHLWVRMGSRTGCSSCDNGTGCGAGLFARLLRRQTVVLELARNGVEVEAGQMLTLAFPESVFTKLVFASYGWPLLAALTGAYAGYGAGSWSQSGPLLTDVLTLAGGCLAAWLFLRFVRHERTMQTLLDSLSVAVCSPSVTPGMCNDSAHKPGQVY